MPLLYTDLGEGRAPTTSGVARLGTQIVALDTGPGIARLPQQVIVHVVSRRRTRAMKEKLCEPLATNPADRCGLDPADVIVPVTENGDEGRSFGHGRAQFLTGEPQ